MSPVLACIARISANAASPGLLLRRRRTQGTGDLLGPFPCKLLLTKTCPLSLMSCFPPPVRTAAVGPKLFAAAPLPSRTGVPVFRLLLDLPPAV
eukprot:scaffold58972_cov64-Attheya_sp.AAC.5